MLDYLGIIGVVQVMPHTTFTRKYMQYPLYLFEWVHTRILLSADWSRSFIIVKAIVWVFPVPNGPMIKVGPCKNGRLFPAPTIYFKAAACREFVPSHSSFLTSGNLSKVEKIRKSHSF